MRWIVTAVLTGMRQSNGMGHITGITGGAGAGKSAILKHLEKVCAGRCRIILADEAGNDIKRKGQPGYAPLVELFGNEILDGDGEIDRAKMAKAVFADPGLRIKVNGILHPLVNAFIMEEIRKVRAMSSEYILFIEAALLIENGYKEIVDELWYIYASSATRRQRLKETRGYSDERIDGIFAGQLTDGEFREAADLVIDNDGDIDEALRQVDEALADRGFIRYAEC